MRIVKVLNNNVVLAKDDQSADVIVMGKGLGFQKKPGDLVQESKIAKYFTLESRDTYLKFKHLVQSIDPAAVDIGEKIISHALNRFPDKRFNDSIHIALIDHINGVMERQKRGYVIDNAIWTEIKRIYREEFEIGTYAVHLLNQKFGYHLSNDEAAFIAVHLINAQSTGTPPDVEKVSQLIRDITIMVNRYFNIEPDEDSVNYYRFVEHIKIMSHCIFNKEAMDNKKDDDGLLEFLQVKYPDIADCVEKINKMFTLKYNSTINSEDKGYLILYIERLIR